jgi:leucine-rich repeat protein SHOC2
LRYDNERDKYNKLIRKQSSSIWILLMKLNEWLSKLLGKNWDGDIFQITHLNLPKYRLSSLPESIGELTNLRTLNLRKNSINNLPESLGRLTNLQELNLADNRLSSLPESLGRLTNLQTLQLDRNIINNLPESLGQLTNLQNLHLVGNKLNNLPESIGQLTNLQRLDLAVNRLSNLPEPIGQLTNLQELNLMGNQITDLSILHKLERLQWVGCFRENLPDRYWKKPGDWKPEWLLDENNAEIRRLLIQNIGYEKICNALGAEAIDSWREYTLLKIKDIQPVRRDNIELTILRVVTQKFLSNLKHKFLEIMKPSHKEPRDAELIQMMLEMMEPSHREPMLLLKMTCPSTGHIHVLRVPPQMSSAEAAITWVNHGIHPDDFTTQT